MVARGYSTAALVAEELSVELTAPQLDKCADLIEAAEHEVDRETGRTWLTTSPVTNELHTVNGPTVYLKHRPVGAITSLSMRSLAVGSGLVELEDGIHYELIDPTNGIILLAGYGYPVDVVINTEYTSHNGWLLTVNYTLTSNVIDPAIRKITTELVATWMSGIVGAGLSGIKSFEVPDLLSVTYRDGAASSLTVPTDIQRRLRLFEQVILA